MVFGCQKNEDPPPQVEAYEYLGVQAVGCEAGARPGPIGASDGHLSVSGLRYHVRTPSNYNPTVAHPLLMVSAAAGQTGQAMERFTGLTPAATKAGMIVAYVDHQPLNIPTIEKLATVPGEIARTWCIDERRVYITGHSDGGTAALALAVLDQTKQVPAAIAPSAAGWTSKDLEAYHCPAPLPVMIFHGKNDRLFPGWGRQTAAWWASCNHCNTTKTTVIEAGCVAYQHCDANGPTLYCEGSGGHRDWPGQNHLMIKFFTQPEMFRQESKSPVNGGGDSPEE
ncbi:alpha/beta hydrolase family esterase [Candidatus Nitrospira inopinata]|jgi:polyhydroxybutyrate depolymerase|uniref:Poly(3-hydroxybutyrate) depolymerase-like protein n=1 Tax=Candidatus Nitrospira inopinata TaxID=1715989 RepID=A0A0S4KWU6_9BACT